MNRLKEVRKKRGFVLQRMAVASGVSTATLNAIEKYGYVPRPETQERLASALGVPVSELWPNTPMQANR